MNRKILHFPDLGSETAQGYCLRLKWKIYSKVQLGGLVLGLSLVGPAKVKACKSFLFTEGSLKLKITTTTTTTTTTITIIYNVSCPLFNPSHLSL